MQIGALFHDFRFCLQYVVAAKGIKKGYDEISQVNSLV